MGLNRYLYFLSCSFPETFPQAMFLIESRGGACRESGKSESRISLAGSFPSLRAENLFASFCATTYTSMRVNLSLCKPMIGEPAARVRSVILGSNRGTDLFGRLTLVDLDLSFQFLKTTIIRSSVDRVSPRTNRDSL